MGGTAASSRDEKPEGDLQLILNAALEGTNERLRLQALGLISRWRVAELQYATATLAFTDGTAQATRLAAVRTLGALGADETKRLAKLIGSDAPAGLRIAGLESLPALTCLKPPLGAGMIAEGQTVDEALQTFLNREAGGDALTTALAKARIGKAPAATALARLQSDRQQ